jgi:hypothetical protein
MSYVRRCRKCGRERTVLQCLDCREPWCWPCIMGEGVLPKPLYRCLRCRKIRYARVAAPEKTSPRKTGAKTSTRPGPVPSRSSRRSSVPRPAPAGPPGRQQPPQGNADHRAGQRVAPPGPQCSVCSRGVAGDPLQMTCDLCGRIKCGSCATMTEKWMGHCVTC